ncbi:DWNN-domain-containing protein [Piedraia hortae CBS 480.64]|uniref:DWNN-domain-containing protein n=1 Tax=Piedraia hortae CBS 480.64 TaxID=1314780 RepID=A0A6A7C7L5_9PEZI|nr:DWNN-domain-containing protein [Piedraia hortae CBS 480.64]
MSSCIFFRFKSQKEPLAITFDGSTLSVFEVKRQIIAISRLGDGTDFDLEIRNPDDGTLYDDDTTQIMRASTVIAQRRPAMRPGAGRAARYVTGKMPVNAKNQHRVEASRAATSGQLVTPPQTSFASTSMSDEEKLRAALGLQDEIWKQDAALKAGKPVIRSNMNKVAVPDRPLPKGYTCYRCGKKGHWIQACPTNGDLSFDGRPKIRRTTGIPKSMLRKIDQSECLGEDGQIDVLKLPKGAMCTAEGEWVIAVTDSKAWEKYIQQHKASEEEAKEAAANAEELKKLNLLCPIDNRAFEHATKTTCCGTTYCRSCIEMALYDKGFKCPSCGLQALLDDLVDDLEAQEKVNSFRAEKAAAKAAAAAAASAEETSTPEPGSPESSAPSTASSSKRKRPADDELENDRKPANPAIKAKSPTPSSVAAAATKEATKTKETAKETAKETTAEQEPPQFKIAASPADFARQMEQMAASTTNNGTGADANNSMAMMMMMGMMNPMMYGVPNMNLPNMQNMPMPNMRNMPNMQNMGNMGSMPMGSMPMQMGMGMNMPQNWQAGGAYFRPPVNQNKVPQRRQRSVDYKQMGN